MLVYSDKFVLLNVVQAFSITSGLTPSVPIIVAPVRIKSCGVHFPPGSDGASMFELRLFIGGFILRCLPTICLANDFKPRVGRSIV